MPPKQVLGTQQGWGKVVGCFEGFRNWPSESYQRSHIGEF